MTRDFDTAYDPRLVGMVLGALVLPWILIANDARSQPVPREMWWTIAGVTLFILTLLRVTAWPVRYVIDDEVLVVRSGFITYRIVLGSIVRVEPSRSWLSSPAWSLDRLRIVFRAGRGLETALMISPKDKDAFIASLEAVAGRSLRA